MQYSFSCPTSVNLRSMARIVVFSSMPSCNDFPPSLKNENKKKTLFLRILGDPSATSPNGIFSGERLHQALVELVR